MYEEIKKNIEEFDEEFGEDTNNICSAHNGTVQTEIKQHLIQSHISLIDKQIKELEGEKIYKQFVHCSCSVFGRCQKGCTKSYDQALENIITKLKSEQTKIKELLT